MFNFINSFDYFNFKHAFYHSRCALCALRFMLFGCDHRQREVYLQFFLFLAAIGSARIICGTILFHISNHLKAILPQTQKPFLYSVFTPSTPPYCRTFRFVDSPVVRSVVPAIHPVRCSMLFSITPPPCRNPSGHHRWVL